jgi:hypothetical protein
MLHKETVHERTLDLIHRLMDDENLKNFHLVGGTALALMLGHRVSVDIDLFTTTEFNGDQMAQYLKDNYDAVFRNSRNNYIAGYIEGIQFDMLIHQYSHVMPLVNAEGIRMSSLEDIAAMKINAIAGNGSRIKDFVDIHYLLKELSYEQMLDAYSAKYPNIDVKQARMSLLYFDDIDFTTKVVLMKDDFKWNEVKNSIKNASDQYDRVLKNAVKPEEKVAIKKEERKKRGLRP